MAISNPFARDSEGSTRNVTAYKIFTILSWLLMFATTIMYSSHAPYDGRHRWAYTIFGVDSAHRSPFSPNHIFMEIYWIVLFIGQIGYVWHLFSSTDRHRKDAASVGPHFILFNLFQFAWIMLWCRSWLFLSELMMILNFFNMLSLYLRNSTTCRTVHVPAIAMPLVYTFFGVMWNGAVMVHCHSLACRILGNIAVWGFLFFGLFFLAVYRDYYIGFSLSFLMAGLAVGNFFSFHALALQWIFSFTIMALLFIASIIVGIPGALGTRTGHEASSHPHGGERAPLLQDA